MGRVAPGITPWRSHRSVRAQLRHTARQVVASLRTARTRCRRRARSGDCFASSAIRCCFVGTVPGFDAPAMFPSNGSTTRRPLPSAGSPQVGFPDLTGTMERSDSLPLSRRAWLCFAWRYHDVRLHFAPAGPARVTDRPGVRHPVSGRNDIVAGTGRPKFLGSPVAPLPCSSTPAAPRTPGLCGVSAWPPASARQRLPRVGLSGLNSTALALAVYASQ